MAKSLPILLLPESGWSVVAHRDGPALKMRGRLYTIVDATGRFLQVRRKGIDRLVNCDGQWILLDSALRGDNWNRLVAQSVALAYGGH